MAATIAPVRADERRRTQVTAAVITLVDSILWRRFRKIGWL